MTPRAALSAATLIAGMLAFAPAAGAAGAEPDMAQRLAACGGKVIRLTAPQGTDAATLERAERVLNARLSDGGANDFVAIQENGLVVSLPASTVNMDAFAPILESVDVGFFAVDDAGAPVTVQGGRVLHLAKEPLLTGNDITDVLPILDANGRPALSFRFTARNIGAPFVIMLDGEVVSAPVIQSAIYGGTGMITGSFTDEDISEMASKLNSGQLPVDLVIESVDEVAGDPEADQSLCPQLNQ